MKWYFRNAILVIAFLIVGPFMLPLIWLHPRFNIKSKLFWTIIILILTFIIAKWMAATISLLKEHFQLLDSIMKQWV